MMYRVIDLEQRSPEWVEFRKGKIGASSAADILGIGFRTPLQLWEDMILDRKVEVNSHMQRGIDFEPVALEWFNRRMGREFKPLVAQSVEHPNLISSLDGWDGEVHCEIKVPSMKKHNEFMETEVVPAAYYAQMQHQMMVMGNDYGFYVSFNGTYGHYVMVRRDDDFIKKLKSMEMRFISHLIDFKPPEPTDKDRVVIDDSTLVVKGERYADLERLIDELSIERDEIKDELKEMVKHPRSVIGPLLITKVIRPGSIDYSAIPELIGVDLNKYRGRAVQSWRVTTSRNE